LRSCVITSGRSSRYYAGKAAFGRSPDRSARPSRQGREWLMLPARRNHLGRAMGRLEGRGETVGTTGRTRSRRRNEANSGAGTNPISMPERTHFRRRIARPRAAQSRAEIATSGFPLCGLLGVRIAVRGDRLGGRCRNEANSGAGTDPISPRDQPDLGAGTNPISHRDEPNLGTGTKPIPAPERTQSSRNLRNIQVLACFHNISVPPGRPTGRGGESDAQHLRGPFP
jgi:hypothetical protein